jgi:PDZ domain-containing protein
MSRQLRTLAVGAVLCLVLVVAMFGFRVPYVVLSPGPTVDTLGKDKGKDIILITGHRSSPTSGHLNLTTVSVQTEDATVAGAIRGWIARDQVVVPHDSVYPPGVSQQQTDRQDRQDFVQSQDSATAAAACELRYPRGFGVISVSADSPNASVLKAGDQFVSVAGSTVTDDASLRKVLATLKQGSKVPVIVNREGSRAALTVTLGAPAEGGTTPRLGITVAQGCLLPFEVTLDLGGIGGPSAGLMFALVIIDKVGTDYLTRGLFIAGTGTIDPAGAVGRIGGIQLKMLGARRAGATVFLAPDGNCDEVRGNIPSGLHVIKVSTLHGAIQSLDTLAAGGAVPHC